jgi:FkbM family methyltransferase
MTDPDTAGSWEEVIRLGEGLKENIAALKNAANKEIVIFGAGRQGKSALQYLKKEGVSVSFFIDNNPEKHGTMLDGIPVVSPADGRVTSASIILIANRGAFPSIRRQLDESRALSLSFDAFFAVDNIDRILNVRNNLLYDPRSRLIYDAILKTMITGDNIYCSSVMEGNQYFAIPEFANIGNDHFVDAGAYVGDTTEKFIWISSGVFSKIYAFEPGERQLTAMKHRAERLCREWAIPESSIVCENAGLSDKNGHLGVNTSSGLLANTSLNNDCSGDDKRPGNVFCCSLDNYLAGRPATFIKADIEGMEMAMLYGAKKTIREFKPKMALSIYHNPFHLVEIPEYVNLISPEYRMAVRHHSPIFAESVLYCWIERY